MVQRLNEILFSKTPPNHERIVPKTINHDVAKKLCLACQRLFGSGPPNTSPRDSLKLRIHVQKLFFASRHKQIH
jgi:hypothetical protein